MKCSICGTESKGDARFCSGCGATLILPKTDETMLDLRTALFRRPVIIPAAPPGGAAPASGGAPQAGRGPPPPNTPIAGSPRASQSNTGALALVLIAIAIVGYFLYQVATTYGGSWLGSSNGTSTTPMKPVEPRVPPPSIAQAEPPEQERSTHPRVASPEPVVRPAPAVAAAQNVAVPPKPAAAPAQSSAVASQPAAPSAPPKPAPRTDRWHDMKEALGRCAQENLVNRVVCEQRVVSLYCSGYWGTVPQCPEAQNPFR